MTKMIRLVAFFGILLLSLETFSKVDSQDEKHTRGRIVDGHVIYGETLKCEIWNESHRPMRVMSYTYEIYFRGRDGRVQLARRDYDCRYNCRVPNYSSQVLTGPLNNGPTISANCFAYVR